MSTRRDRRDERLRRQLDRLYSRALALADALDAEQEALEADRRDEVLIAGAALAELLVHLLHSAYYRRRREPPQEISPSPHRSRRNRRRRG